MALTQPTTADERPAPAQEAEVARSKRAARARGRALRDALTSVARAEAAQAISAHVLALLPRLPARSDHVGHTARGVGLYSTLGSEVDTRPLQLALTRRCFPFALPTVLGDASVLGQKALGFAMVDARTELTLSPLGIPEPHVDHAFEPGCHHRLAALLVPCLAFSGAGVRLGYGRGYYDRLLAHYGGHIIGLAYACQRDDSLMAGPHDVPLHGVITEAGLHLPQGSPLATQLTT